jgi:hypothetical protein
MRRRPREVYRVYSEDEYLNAEEYLNLNGIGSELASAGGRPAAVEPARRGSGERRLRRVAGVTMLAGAVGAVGGVVVMNGPWAQRSAARGPGHLVAATRSPIVPPVIVAPREARSRPVVARRVMTTRSPVRSRPRRAGSDSHALQHPLAHLSARPRESAAIVVDYVPRPSADAPSATGASATVSATPAAVEAAPKPAAPSERAEFGFER